MAEPVIQLDQEKLSCPICLELLSDPVTIPCGHSYCMHCIKDCWDTENVRKTHSCPQCRQSFVPRPGLVKNTMLAKLVEELMKAKLEAATPDRSFAGPGDVSCDFCTGIKLKASKSCLVCMASYCEQHLQPHYTVIPLKKHKLVEATLKLQENICPRHDEVKKIFCRTDQQCICFLCSMDDHKGHDTVPTTTERAERQVQLGVSQQKIQQRIHNIEKYITVLQQRVVTVNVSADEAVRDTERISTEMKHIIDKRSLEVKLQIRSQQETEVVLAKELEKKLQQEITELQRRNIELEMLSCTEDHLHFLNSYPSHQTHLSKSEGFLSINVHPICSFKDIAVAVSKARDKLQTVLSEEWAKISLKVTEVEIVQPKSEPRTREEFLRHSCVITLDPNTAHNRLSLSENNRKATLLTGKNAYCSHPERFLERWQVLSKEGFSGRCYWEVKWSGAVYIAVAYKNISRTGTRNECGFGYNEKSWALLSKKNQFNHNGVVTLLSGPMHSTIGVYLDHTAGVLCFYNICETTTLIHRVQTTFTQPLHLGFWFPDTPGSTAELCQLK